MSIQHTLAGIASACIILSSCTSSTNENKTEKTEVKDSVKIEAEPKKQLAFDTLLTDASRFIAGMPTHKYLKEEQAAEYYSEHKTFTDESWKITQDSMINPVQKWCADNKIQDQRDSLLCFYPLSGPDFLFGNAFFPTADHFVMLGLEPRGNMVDFRELKEAEIIKYLSGIRQSMKYINSRGYFVTSHMSSDFTKAHLNGMLHMMLYMMARTNHAIVDIYNVKIDSTGKAIRLAEGEKYTGDSPLAVKIEFLSPDGTELRDAYYFKMNAADDYLLKHTEFETFVNGFGHRVSYMKSASCVLQNTPFSVMRKLVLNSDKVLQDDTGVPYKYFLDDSTFSISLYGTYSQTIDDLDWCMQKQLKKDLEASKHYGNLPFKISYNGNYGEGMMIWAVKK
ncbi:MAG: hypothetical protein K1X56_05050 [Flavobacteriales bacterium]|nr:hypothetical protein [Flavobacteriales bacterium]